MTTQTIHESPDKLGFVAGYIERGLRLNRAGECLPRLTGPLAGLGEGPAGEALTARTAMKAAYVSWSYAYGRRPKQGADWRAFRDSFHRALSGRQPS